MNKRQIEKRISLIPESYINSNYIIDTEYLFLLKKTEKIIVATYILTDFIPVSENLKRTLKDNSHDVLNSVCELLYSRENRSEVVQKIRASFIKMLTQYSIAEISGFISKMNSDIIKNEINNLIKIVGDLERELVDEKTPDLKNSYFNVDIRNKRQYSSKTQGKKDFYKGQNKKDKDTIKDINVLNSADRSGANVFNINKNDSDTDSFTNNSREEKILDIIRDKKNVSIKDISNLVLDCSEKTIQRALNKMIDDNKIIKKGERRWARYEIL